MTKEGQNTAFSKECGGRTQCLEWLGLRELTQYAAVSERTVRVWIHSPVDPLPAVQVGTKILVSRRAFDVWLQSHAVKPAGSVDLDATVDEILTGVAARTYER